VKRVFFFTLAAVTCFKLWAMQLFPITCDEAYYWLWQKHLALSFVDHPPAIAYFNKFVGLFGAYNLFHYRLAALLLALLATYFVYAIGKTLFDERTGLIAATFFQLVPHYVIIWLTLTIDNLLVLFWLISLYWAARIVKTGEDRNWYWLGLSFGLGLLCKYTMAFFLFPLLLWLVIDKEGRRWLTRPAPYLGFILSLFVFSPVLIWNYQHAFASFLFHAGRLGRADFWGNLSIFAGDQLVHFTPFLFLGLLIYGRKLWDKSRFLWLFSLPLLLLFAGFCSFIRVWAHWVTVYQFAAIVGLAALVSPGARTTKRLIAALWVFVLLVAAVLLFGSPMLLPRQTLYRHNYDLAARYHKVPLQTYIITPYLGSSSQVAFYARRTTYMTDGVLSLEEEGFGYRQYIMWGYPELKPGDNIIYYGKNNGETLAKLKRLFRAVAVDQELKYYALESYLDDLVPYSCRGLKRPMARL
jgi:4-amino-4-deoxy-L-arabinose transferase-like glycosyltransferase